MSGTQELVHQLAAQRSVAEPAGQAEEITCEEVVVSHASSVDPLEPPSHPYRMVANAKHISCTVVRGRPHVQQSKPCKLSVLTSQVSVKRVDHQATHLPLGPFA